MTIQKFHLKDGTELACDDQIAKLPSGTTIICSTKDDSESAKDGESSVLENPEGHAPELASSEAEIYILANASFVEEEAIQQLHQTARDFPSIKVNSEPSILRLINPVTLSHELKVLFPPSMHYPKTLTVSDA